MKKITHIFLLIACILFTFSACKSDSKNDKPHDDDEENTTVEYAIDWIDEKGNLIKSEKVEEGKNPSCSYYVNDTPEWDYTFEGWSATQNGEVIPSIPKATKNATYYAVVSSTKQVYSVRFVTSGGSTVENQRIEYGSTAQIPENPTYEGYRFVGWSTTADGSEIADLSKAVTANIQYYAIWNKIINVKELLASLLDGYELNPLQYIPESMLPGFSDNLVSENDLISDYSSFVSTDDIVYGFGEQWHMILENLQQAQTFFGVLSVIDTISTASISAFNNYFDNNPSDTARHEFESGIYNVLIDFDGEIISYVLDYTTTLPVLGEQTVQIALSMIAESGEKAVRIQLGDANALTYKIFENSYEFAIKYLGVRRAFFSLERDDDGSVNGRIYEHLTASAVEISSAAEFYITDDYVSVVGNKANGMVGFTGFINELYQTDSGKLLGYEVQETLSSIVYNTLWLNLSDISGIQSIKYRSPEGEAPGAFFVNRSSSEWQSKKVGGIGTKMFSRRFDIEFRTQYVYSYDNTTDTYVEHEIKVPMFFVQEEYYGELISDVKATNNITIIVTANELDVQKIFADYKILIPIFALNKDSVTPEIIIAYIGEKITV